MICLFFVVYCALPCINSVIVAATDYKMYITVTQRIMRPLVGLIVMRWYSAYCKRRPFAP